MSKYKKCYTLTFKHKNDNISTMSDILPSSETGPEVKEHLLPGQSRTAIQIEDSARMLAMRADEIGGYRILAPLAPEGFSEVLPGGLDRGGKVFIKETGVKPGTNNRATRVQLMTEGKHADISTDGQEASGSVKSTATGREISKLTDTEIRSFAAEALWDKRRQLEQRKKAVEAARKNALKPKE